MRSHLKLLSLVSAAALLAACSGDSDEPEEAAAPEPQGVADADPDPAPANDPNEAAPPAANGDVVPPEDAVIEIRELNDWYRAVLVDEAAIADVAQLEEIGREICIDMTPCRAALWYDARIAPATLPISSDALAAQVFAFGRNSEGEENANWNCDVFFEEDVDRRCLPRLMQ